MTASKELLEKLHAAVGANLLAQIESGEAPASVYAQAIKFLSDNDISSEANPATDKLKEVLGKMPFTNTDDPTQFPAH